MSRRNGARGAAAHSREGVAPPEVRREARARPPARARSSVPGRGRGEAGGEAGRRRRRYAANGGAVAKRRPKVRRDGRAPRPGPRFGANVAGRVPRWSTRGVRDCVGRASREGGRARSVAAFARTSAQARRGAALGAAVSEFDRRRARRSLAARRRGPGPGGAWQPARSRRRATTGRSGDAGSSRFATRLFRYPRYLALSPS